MNAKSSSSSAASPLFFKNRRTQWLAIGCFGLLLGLLKTNMVITERLASGYPIPWKYPFIYEMTGAGTIFLLLFPLIWFFKRFPLKRKNLARYIPFYMAVSVVFGSCHTALMWLSRELIFWVGGFGDYDYGVMTYRLIMEYNHQILTFWAVYAVVYVAGYVRRSQEQKLKAAQLEQQLSKARLQALQMQLNPHFLFNTLNMISSTMYEDVKSADKMIAYLSDLLRMTLKRSGAQEYSLEKEQQVLHLYLEIMKARYRDKLTVHEEIETQARPALVPGFILQPLVENSIKYGMESLKEVEIIIAARRRGDRLELEVKDDGPGLPVEPEHAMKQGVGLSNTSERLEKLYGHDHSFLLLNREGGGLRIVIDLPYKVSRSGEEGLPGGE